MDYFNLYNNSYSHLIGDDCLKKVAQTLTKTVKRSGDLVARFGGEEFVIILPNTDLNGAEKVAQAVNEEIKQLNLPHNSSKVSDAVTLSLGLASMIPTHENQSTLLIKSADRALYHAKTQGRNRYILHPQS